MAAKHYWLGRIHGMMEAKAIVENLVRLGDDAYDAVTFVEDIAKEIRYDLEQGDRQMLASRFTLENWDELPPDLLQEIQRPT